MKYIWCRPGQPTIDMTHFKKVYAKCTNPTTQTSPTSPIFDIYLADLAATFTAANPLLLTGECAPTSSVPMPWTPTAFERGHIPGASKTIAALHAYLSTDMQSRVQDVRSHMIMVA